MKQIKPLLLCLVIILLLVGCQAPPETAESVLQKILAAHDKEGGLQKIQGLLFHGHVQALTEENQGKLWILYRHPEKLRVVAELQESKEDRLYLAGEGWTDNGSGFLKASGMTLDLMKFQTEHLSLTLGLLEGRYQVRLLEAVTEDKPVALVLTDVDGLETKISVDPFRWVVRTVEREFEINGQKAVMAVLYEEYRTVKGVQLPHRILNFVNGKPVGRTDFTSIQTNPSVPENIFSAPGDGAR